MAFAPDKFRIDGKVAIVTGAGGRPNSIGEAYCFALANAGASVVCADLDVAGAQSVAAKLKQGGAKALGVGVDITKPDSAAAMVATARATFGGVDILVNNAALMVEIVGEPAKAIGLENWNRAFAVNVTGALNCTQAVLPTLRERGGGRIVNQVSGGAYPPASVYGVTKLALVGLTTTLAKELGPENINVNAIAPGYTSSDAGLSLTPDDGEGAALMRRIVAKRVRGHPDELCGALLLLCSDAGDWITGQVLHVDGGWVLRP